MKKFLLSAGFVFVLSLVFNFSYAQNDKGKITLQLDNGKTFKIDISGDTVIIGTDTGVIKTPLRNGIIRGPFIYRNGEVWKQDSSTFNQFFNSFQNLFNNRPYLGVKTEKDKKGIRIEEVVPGSPAEKAGLQKGDIITKIDEKTVGTPEEFLSAVSELKPDEKAKIAYLRNNKKQETLVVPGTNNSLSMDKLQNLRGFSFTWPEGDGNRNAPFRRLNPLDNQRPTPVKPKLGMQVQDTENDEGVTVLKVTPGSPADEAGIKEGDLITEINGNKVNSVNKAQSEIRSTEGNQYPLQIQRGKKAMNVTITIPKPLKKADL